MPDSLVRRRKTQAPGDRWGSRDAEVVFDFWRFLGAEVNTKPTADLFAAPVRRRFSIVPDCR